MRHWFLIIAATIIVGGCGHPERYGCNILPDKSYVCLDGTSGRVIDGDDGKDGLDAQICTVSETPNGAIITCPDGSSVEILDGTDGEDGTSVTIICHKRTCVKRGHHAKS